MKRIYTTLFVISLLCVILTGCKENSGTSESEQNAGKLTVVATLFPQYDFARIIGGEKVDVSLLLPPGMESHSFEPTPGDIIAIHNADVFLYTGDEMEPWVAGITAGINETSEDSKLSTNTNEKSGNSELNIDLSGISDDAGKKTNRDKAPYVVDLSHGITLCEDDHDHDHEPHEQGTHEEEVAEDGHTHAYNPHIWTSPVMAMTMVENVVDAFVKADPENAAYYEANGEAYLEQLHELDHEIRHIVEEADFDTVYVGSKFSLLYFMEEYGLHYVAAYDSCEEEAEPSIKKVVSMIEDMKDSGISTVYYQELIEPYIANTIAEATGGEALLFHSCHNVSKEELESGMTYLSLMEQNALNLEKGLNR